MEYYMTCATSALLLEPEIKRGVIAINLATQGAISEDLEDRKEHVELGARAIRKSTFSQRSDKMSRGFGGGDESEMCGHLRG